MALSQDEQRVLAEIERRLTADDPGLATCLTAFRRPSPATVLSSPRVRIIGSLFTVLLVAMVSLMVYAMIPFRAHGARPPAAPSAGTRTGVSIASAGSGKQVHLTQPAAASGSAKAVAGNFSAAPGAGTSRAERPKDDAAGRAASPTARP